jgi:hypothetical protein
MGTHDSFVLIPSSAAVVLVPNHGSVKDSIWELKILPRPPHLVISLIRLIALFCPALLVSSSTHQELAPYTNLRVMASRHDVSKFQLYTCLLAARFQEH